eukprot:NODE_33_length_32023_cov_0.217579.p24 type:complete len:114 gc:universal NODE_33_length_32023_cov_0.217579:22217-21876(-)
MHSFPTKASPTKTILSIGFIWTNFPKDLIKGSSSCILPAVSIKTTSKLFALAYPMASLATAAASFLYPCWKSSIVVSNVADKRSTWIASCSTAPLLKVSQAAIKIDFLWIKSQ